MIRTRMLIKNEGRATNSSPKPGTTNDAKPKVAQYYAVAVGRDPGLYTSWDEAWTQIDSYDGYKLEKFETRAEAVTYLRSNSLLSSSVRLFRKTFEAQPNFTPAPDAPFDDEFKRFALTQSWTEYQRRKAKVDSIVDELISHYLPEGITLAEESVNGDVNLTDQQMLKIYQGMCRTAKKSIHSTIDNSLLELNRAPYVNIIDFINTFRTGQKVNTYESWDRFVWYTMQEGNRIDLKFARENEFLAPLLQDLRLGPGAIDPIKRRKSLLAAKAKKKRKAKSEPLPPSNRPFSSVYDVNTSPPMSDASPSSSRLTTPERKDSYPQSNASHTTTEKTLIKPEPISSTIVYTPSRPQSRTANSNDEKDRTLELPLGHDGPQSSQIEERHLSPVLVPKKRKKASHLKREAAHKRSKIAKALKA